MENRDSAVENSNSQVLNNTPSKPEYRTFEHHGVTIWVTHRGSFTATIDEITITKDRYADIQKEIERVLSKRAKRRVSLPVVAIMKQDGWNRKTTDDTMVTNAVTGINRNSRNLEFTHAIPEGFDLLFIIPDTPTNRRRTLALIDAKREYDRLHQEQMDLSFGATGHGRIDVEDYDAVLTQMEKRYKDALARSEAAQEVISHE